MRADTTWDDPHGARPYLLPRSPAPRYAEELLSRALRELEAHERSGLRDGLRDSRRGAVTGSGRGSNADSERARAATLPGGQAVEK